MIKLIAEAKLDLFLAALLRKKGIRIGKKIS